jgi:hypothetical protein
MKHLKLSMIDMPREFGHAQLAMKALGITYQHATPQSMYDQWWFWNCENIPNPLPGWLSELTVQPMSAVGYGLTKEEALEIQNKGFESA